MGHPVSHLILKMRFCAEFQFSYSNYNYSFSAIDATLIAICLHRLDVNSVEDFSLTLLANYSDLKPNTLLFKKQSIDHFVEGTGLRMVWILRRIQHANAFYVYQI